MTEDRRHPRRPFDPSLVRNFLRGRTLVSVELFPSGKSSTNYKLVLSDGFTCVLRLSARGTIARENYIMGLVRTRAGHRAPVPDVLDQGEDWAVYSFIAGEHLADAPQHTRAAAEALAAVSSIQFQSAGWVQADGSVTPFHFDGDGGDKGFVPAMLERPDVHNWIGLPAVATLYRVLDAEAHRSPDQPARHCLCHGDYNPTNILVRGGAVSGILDWEFAHSGDRFMDVGNLLRHTPPPYQEQISQGLAAGGFDLPANWRVRAELIDLSSHLEFLTSARSDEFKRQCVGWIHSFIDRYLHLT